MSYEISRYEVEKLDPNVSIKTGHAFNSQRFTDNENDIALVKGENIHQGYIDWLGAKRWPKEEFSSLEKYHLAAGDIVLAMDRPWVTAGLKWSYIKPHDPKSILVQRVARLRAKGKLNQSYLRHVISSNYFAKYLQPIVTGVNVPHISAKQIGNFQIPIPESHIQHKITAILTAYDDLIDSNKRRITLLEKIVEELYCEWFVRMRFPGYQNTRFVKGVPERWEPLKLDDLIPPNGLETGKRPEGGAEEFGIPSIGAENVNGIGRYNFSKEKYVNEGFYASMRQGRVMDKDVLFYKDGAEIGRVTLFQDSFPYQKCCVNEHVFLIRTNDLRFQYFLYCYLNQPQLKEYVKLVNKNAAQPGINKAELRSIPIMRPIPSLIDNFNELVSPLISEIFTLAKSERVMQKTRDLLLQRLLSGKLLVENLDIQFPPSMRDVNSEHQVTHA